MEGELFGPYRLDKQLGGGGVGEVWRAYDTRAERLVALKRLRVELGADPEYRERFSRECAVVSRLSEPHVIPIHSFGEIDGRLYLDMRLVEGVDLGRLLEREGPLDEVRGVAILTQVASALDAAHADGLVHRDIKPSNILVTGAAGREYAYLADFGVARALQQNSAMTQPGVVVGTVSYLAPEQFSGEAVDGQSDVYALACVLFEVLTGRRPFAQTELLATMFAHLQAPRPRPSELGPHVSPRLDEVVARGMAVERSARFATAGDLMRAAHAAVDGRGAPGRRPAPGSSPDVTAGRAALLSPPQPRWPDVGSRRAVDPAEQTRQEFLLRARLHPQFRIPAGPSTNSDPIPFLDNQAVVDTLRERLQYSQGGAILLTGFAGVGKTTAVERALTELRGMLAQQLDEPVPLVEVRVDIRRPIPPDELIVTLIRTLHETLERTGVRARLEPSVRDRLDLAYLRTTQTLKRSRTVGGEGGAELAVGEIKISGKRSRQLGSETTYLPYSPYEAERDFTSLLAELGRPVPTSARRWWLRRPRRWNGRLVVVIDELDKLTAEPEGERCLAEILTGLKNIFATSNAHFVFVAGPDVLDRARLAQGRGVGLYDGVFGLQPYVPCVSSTAAHTVIARVAADGALGDLGDYLTYRSRGLPRLLLQEMGRFVVWPGGEPWLVVSGRNAPMIRFFAGLQQRLAHLPPPALGPLVHQIDIDRHRMGAYLLTDWALRRGNQTFSLADLRADDAGRPDTGIVTDALAAELLSALASPQVGILERWDTAASQHTVLDVRAPVESVYRLAAAVRAAASATGEAASQLGRAGGGRYVLKEELGRGAIGRTYRAIDQRDGSSVAVKLLDIPGLAGNDLARRRFRREAELAAGLGHPCLARTHAVLDDPREPLGVVLDLVPGPSLDQVVDGNTIAPRFVVSIGRDLAGLLGHLHGQGIARLDLKPSSIVLREGVRAVVTDLGLARRMEDVDSRLTAVGTVLGTPRYSPPEQLRGEPVDIRGDLFTLGLLLYEALAGTPARAGNARDWTSTIDDVIDVSGLECSTELKRVLATLLEPNRDDRFDDPAALQAALERTPEAPASARSAP